MLPKKMKWTILAWQAKYDLCWEFANAVHAFGYVSGGRREITNHVARCWFQQLFAGGTRLSAFETSGTFQNFHFSFLF